MMHAFDHSHIHNAYCICTHTRRAWHRPRAWWGPTSHGAAAAVAAQLGIVSAEWSSSSTSGGAGAGATAEKDSDEELAR